MVIKFSEPAGVSIDFPKDTFVYRYGPDPHLFQTPARKNTKRDSLLAISEYSKYVETIYQFGTSDPSRDDPYQITVKACKREDWYAWRKSWLFEFMRDLEVPAHEVLTRLRQVEGHGMQLADHFALSWELFANGLSGN